MRIAIIGAGIGGLSAAVGLQRAGAEVTVFERAPEVRAGGSGLSIFANGLAALETLGLSEAFDAVTDASVEGFTAGQRRADGRWIAQVPNDSVGALRIVDRADLHLILLEALTPGTIRTNAEVASARADGTLTFTTGFVDSDTAIVSAASVSAASTDSATASLPSAEVPFDLVIGADGLHSRVRSVVSGEPVAPRYSGYSAWRGITSVPVDLSGEAGESVGRGRRFGIAPLADGRVYWFAVANMPQDAVFADEKATVEQMFAGWHSPIAELIAATPAEEVRRTAISDLSRRLARFHRGRVVLLGDAAHAMTPNLGQGGGQALEDAATLTVLLTPLLAGHRAGSAVETALQSCDDLRRPRTQAIARKSRLMGQVFQLESPLLAGLRDAIFSAVPSRFIAAQAASVQKWSPPPV
ncbi:FAD-dependent oxidoreductase [Brevibacterium spongiae]|uniref:FAD-dependent monooxygenase n=1 Tax=Brevibacterium spongiae TaxID=2909672 RepID=A0ABY5SQQ6_9MICO|nr:FAD-dependent oxidoreductase [Brevibacterium spongiae]UVI35044.1 FAD-dependent monooxygenase [Brevibacterium spongiae]